MKCGGPDHANAVPALYENTRYSLSLVGKGDQMVDGSAWNSDLLTSTFPGQTHPRSVHARLAPLGSSLEQSKGICMTAGKEIEYFYAAHSAFAYLGAKKFM